MNYPATITVPIAEDFCQNGLFYGANNTACLMGWASRHFGLWPDRKLCDACGIRITESLAEFNDGCPTRQDLADAYERFLVLMGYEVTP